MKKLKTICSAIAALTMLALAGCDLEMPDGDKVDYIPGLAMVGAGNADYGSSATAYCIAEDGAWSITTKVDGVTKEVEKSCIGKAWWNASNGKSTAQPLADGSTIVIEAKALKDKVQCFFECEGNKNYVSVNPHKDAWGTGVTYNLIKAVEAKKDKTVTFTAKRTGNQIEFQVQVEN